MAAESTPQQSVEETATPVVLRTQTDDGSHDVVGESSTDAPAGSNVHGESPAAAVDRLVHDIVDEVINSAEVSISGGSDTEASRTDQLKKDDKGHSRTSSAKKPATFKPVSVNKTFLASKATSSTSVPKAGEKPSTPVPSTAAPSSSSSTPKPRLVAKTAGSLRDASKSSLSQNGRSAPDGNAVWNKNRPPPVPDPKKFTDEELAKIGIHMAHRIQVDDSKGQSNAWADIDDDDEDWDAPEAITWTDGTKTTIPHVDETTTILPEQPVIKETKPIDKPRSPAPPVSAPPSNSPSVKPGSLASGKGLVLTKGASSEKPTLVAKPPAPPTPVKSPWAPLPPISKVSPMDVPHDLPQRGFAPPGQAYGLRGGPPPAAREIAADDFSRSPRRDNQQLYNSHSGRYEPVPDRRGMSRTDYPQRQLAVLQRPMHSETQGPAEPSAAFQTSHTSGGFGRRRNSSNVSGGSGSFQRMGRPYDHSMPPADMFNARRSSLAGAGDHPLPPHNFPSSGPPAPSHGGPRSNASPYQSRVSPAMSSAAPVVPDIQEAAVPQPTMENTVEFQKRLMQERRAEAIKRRQEEEAQEEAARKERLAKKLAALGPAPERKSAKKEDSHEAAKAPAAQPSEATETAQVPGPKEEQPANVMADDKSASLPNGAQPDPQARSRPPTGPEQPPVAENKHAHPWQPRMPNQPERIWGSGSQPPRNLWGPPNNDRTLGNGTFTANAGFDTQPPQTAPMHGNRPGPGPIAPPRGAASTGPSSRLGPIGPPQRHEPRSADENERSRNRWAQAAIANDEEIRAGERERRAEMERDMRARGLNYADIDVPIQDSWIERNEEGTVVQKRAELTYTQASAPWHVAPGAGQDDQRRVAVPPSAGQNGSAAATSQSRFFPSSRDAQQLEPLAPDTGRPFEEDAFDGDALYSHAAPPIRVKLPPAPSVSAPPASQRPSQPGPSWGQGPSIRDDGLGRGQTSRPNFGASNTTSGQDANTPIMDRIKNLFADKPSSVNSSSRTALAQPSSTTPATVSLPFIYAPSTIVNERSFTTKKMDEDCFEEQEMGSLPLVQLPADIPDAAYNLAKAPPRQDRRLLPVMATTAEALPFFPDSRNIFIQLPNGPDRKSVPRGTLRSPNPRRASRGSSRYGSSYRGGNRGRDSVTPYSPEQPSASGANTGSGAGRGGRGYRGRSDNWGRAAAPAIQTQ